MIFCQVSVAPQRDEIARRSSAILVPPGLLFVAEGEGARIEHFPVEKMRADVLDGSRRFLFLFWSEIVVHRE